MSDGAVRNAWIGWTRIEKLGAVWSKARARRWRRPRLKGSSSEALQKLAKDAQLAENQIARLADHAEHPIAVAETYPTEAQTDETRVQGQCEELWQSHL